MFSRKVKKSRADSRAQHLDTRGSQRKARHGKNSSAGHLGSEGDTASSVRDNHDSMGEHAKSEDEEVSGKESVSGFSSKGGKPDAYSDSIGEKSSSASQSSSPASPSRHAKQADSAAHFAGPPKHSRHVAEGSASSPEPQALSPLKEEDQKQPKKRKRFYFGAFIVLVAIIVTASFALCISPLGQTAIHKLLSEINGAVSAQEEELSRKPSFYNDFMQTDASIGEKNEKFAGFETALSMLSSLPSCDEEVTKFSMLTRTQLPTESETDELKALIDDIDDCGVVSFALIDLQTMNCFAYNLDASVYGASAFKGPFCAYICKERIDSGEVSLSDTLELKTILYDDESPDYVWGERTLEELLRGVVVDSNNNAYGNLNEQFADEAFSEWLEKHGLDECETPTSKDLPVYTNRSSIKLWLYVFDYLRSGSQTSAFLKDLLQNTNESFIRAALPDDVLVCNKAGWFSDNTKGINSLCDAGIIEDGEDRYLMSLMTQLPDGEAGIEDFKQLVSILHAQRDDLK